MEKEFLIDQITLMALTTMHKRDVLPENYRNFTVYCNQEIKDIIDSEINKRSNGITYIQTINKLKKSAEKFGGYCSVNGIKIKFEVGNEYKILTIAFDTYPPIKN